MQILPSKSIVAFSHTGNLTSSQAYLLPKHFLSLSLSELFSSNLKQKMKSSDMAEQDYLIALQIQMQLIEADDDQRDLSEEAKYKHKKFLF